MVEVDPSLPIILTVTPELVDPGYGGSGGGGGGPKSLPIILTVTPELANPGL